MKIDGPVSRTQPLAGGTSVPVAIPTDKRATKPLTSPDQLSLGREAGLGGSVASESDLVARVKERQRLLEPPGTDDGSIALPSIASVPGTLASGASGPEVARLQAVLQGLGEYSGPISGSFDGPTAASVVAYQRRFGLDDDGVVGPATWRRVLDHEAMLYEGGQLISRSGQAATPAPASPAPAAAPPTFSPGDSPDFRPVHRIDVAPVAVDTQSTARGAREYREMLRLDQQANPYDLAETERMGKSAQAYQESLQTQRVKLSVDGGARTILVTMAPGVDSREALDVVRRLYEDSHPEHRQDIKQINLYTGPNPMDEFYELRNRFGRDFVSEMTGGNGTINFYNVGNPQHPQRQDLWDHELAHVFMQSGAETSSEPMVPKGWVEVVSADRADGRNEFVSTYAATNNKEDFAESYRFYLDAMRNGTLDRFRRDYPNRAAALERLFD